MVNSSPEPVCVTRPIHSCYRFLSNRDQLVLIAAICDLLGIMVRTKVFHLKDKEPIAFEQPQLIHGCMKYSLSKKRFSYLSIFCGIYGAKTRYSWALKIIIYFEASYVICSISWRLLPKYTLKYHICYCVYIVQEFRCFQSLNYGGFNLPVTVVI